MSGTVQWLDPIEPEEIDAGLVDQVAAHPMRRVTHAAAAEVGAWTTELARQVAQTFDDLAPEWHYRHSPDRLDDLADALDRGGPIPDHGWWLELGSGDGWATAMLASRAPRLLAMDLSWKMLQEAPPEAAPRIQADAAGLPVADHAFTVVVAMNMLLFPTELDRVLAPGGALVWLSSRGPATPIHLTPEQVVAALPGRWTGPASQHRSATWTVLRRSG